MKRRFSDPQAPRFLHVFHIGPDPAESGGISSVIASFLDMTFQNVQIGYFVSWKKDSFYGLGPSAKALRSIIKLKTQSKQTNAIHVHFGSFGSYLREGFFLVLSQILGFPTFATLHGGRINRFTKIRLAKILLGLLLLKTKRVYVLNPSLKDRFFSQDSKVKVVVNPLPFMVKENETLDREKGILFAGVRSEAKGLKLLIDAWKQICEDFPEWKLYVAGPQGDFIFKKELSNLIDLGEISRKQVMEHLEKISILCLPSYNEQSPMIIWEAMGKGVCVVSTNVGAIPWIIGDDYPYLCNPGDLDGLIRALKLCMNSNNHEINALLKTKAKNADLNNASIFWNEEYQRALQN